MVSSDKYFTDKIANPINLCFLKKVTCLVEHEGVRRTRTKLNLN